MRQAAAETPHARMRLVGVRASALRALSIGLAMLLPTTLVAVLTVAPAAVAAQTSDEAAQQAALEIQQARDRANAAAEALFLARSDLEVLGDEAGQLEKDIAELDATVEMLRRDVESVALALFAAGASAGIPLLTGLRGPEDLIQAELYGDVVNDTGANAIDEYESVRSDLKSKQAELRGRLLEIEEQERNFAELKEAAMNEVRELRRVEEQRLTDVAVQRAFAARQAAAISRLEEELIRNAEAARKAQQSGGATVSDDAVAGQAELDPAGLIPSELDRPDTVGGGSADAAGSAASPDGSTGVTSGASGGSSAGRTGNDGAGSSPAAIVTDSGYIDSIACPLEGSAYGDTWGAPRSGGRSHEGVDMIAVRGAPIIAVTTGAVIFKQNNLGGNAVSLVGDNGNRYYYAHLSAYEGVSRRVVEGEVIGYNGDSGNATGIDHLHFEVHPGGGVAVNPTLSVRVAGC